jgi:hypothetical protein
MEWREMAHLLNPMDYTNKKEMHPKFRPIENDIGIEISIDVADGVPLPPQSESFDRNFVVGRAVRVILLDSETNQFISNAC